MASAIVLLLPGTSPRAYAQDSSSPPIEGESSGGSPALSGNATQPLDVTSDVGPGEVQREGIRPGGLKPGALEDAAPHSGGFSASESPEASLALGTAEAPEPPGPPQPLALSGPSPRISTIAGNTGSGRPATRVGLVPTGLALFGRELIVADANGNLIRSVNLDDGSQRVIAGKASAGPWGDGGPALQAQFSGPSQVAVDAVGNVYVADTANHKIRKVDRSSGRVELIAGTGEPGFAGDGGPATSAKLLLPRGVAVDSAGNVYIADSGNNRIRKVDSLSGTITTLAGTGDPGYSGDGGPAASSTLNNPTYAAYDPSGWLWFSDTGNSAVRGVDLGSREVTTLMSPRGSAGACSSVDPRCLNDYPVGQFSLQSALGLTFGRDSRLYVLDPQAGIVWSINTVEKLARARAYYLYLGFEGIAADEEGGIYLSAPAGWVNSTGMDVVYLPPGQWNGEARNRRPIAGNHTPGYSGDGDQATLAQLAVPTGVTRAPSGEVYIADFRNNRVRKIDPSTGKITTVVGGGQQPFPAGDYRERVATDVTLSGIWDVAAMPDGDVLVVNNDRILRLHVRTGLLSVFAGTGERGYRGDWGPATEARLSDIRSVEVGKDGAVYISDWGNNRVRMVRPDGVIVTVAGNGTKGFSGDGGPAVEAALNGPMGLAADAAGQLYIADAGNNRIRLVGRDGRISTFAGNGIPGYGGEGGPAASASLSNPFDVDTDECSGRVFVADAGNHRVRVIEPDGNIYTYAGNGVGDWRGDGGPADSASLNSPLAVHTGPDGALLVADTANQRIRKIDPFVLPPLERSYLAEGATAGGFETWILLSNPDPWRCARARVVFMTGEGRREGPTVVIGPGQRRSVNLDAFVDSFDVAVAIEALDRRVYAERAMYSTHPGALGATVARAVRQPLHSWVVAEGATEGEFSTWILVANPSATETAQVEVTFMTDGGRVGGPALVVPPLSRRSVHVDDWVTTYHVATKVEASRAPVVVERAVYAAGGRLAGATAAPGQQPARLFAFAEGATAGPFETWIVVANPSEDRSAIVVIRRPPVGVCDEGATKTPLTFDVPPLGRISVRLDDVVDSYEAPVVVIADPRSPVVAERITYTTGGDFGRTAAGSEGASKAGWKWVMTEGATEGGFETWVSVYSPCAVRDLQNATVHVYFLTAEGMKRGPTFTLVPHERRTLRVSDYVRSLDVSVVVVSGPAAVVAERSVYSPARLGGDSTTGPGDLAFP